MIGFTQCLAIAASICLDQTANIQIESGPQWKGARISIGKASVISTELSDSVLIPYIPATKAICAEDQCVYYKGSCSANADQRQCKIWYTFGPSMSLREIELDGPDLLLSSLFPHLKLVRSPNLLISFSELNLASDSSPPVCPSREACLRANESGQ